MRLPRRGQDETKHSTSWKSPSYWTSCVLPHPFRLMGEKQKDPRTFVQPALSFLFTAAKPSCFGATDTATRVPTAPHPLECVHKAAKSHSQRHRSWVEPQIEEDRVQMSNFIRLYLLLIIINKVSYIQLPTIIFGTQALHCLVYLRTYKISWYLFPPFQIIRCFGFSRYSVFYYISRHSICLNAY